LHDVLSPFEELNDESHAYLKLLCEQAHGKFVAEVKKQRGNKLKDDPSTFSGEVFTGKEALERGLID
jgi:ClpP class serine protease